jgi:prepilin-type N-terminal cleavage/methylation domain-containing protein
MMPRATRQSGFTMIEMVMGVALVSFVVLACYMAMDTFMATNAKSAGRMAGAQDSFFMLERFRTVFAAMGSGANKRTIGPHDVYFSQQTVTSTGAIKTGATARFVTQCQKSNAKGFPPFLKGVKLPKIPSLCEDFVCPISQRPVVVEQIVSKKGTTVRSYPVRPGEGPNSTVALAMCFGKASGYVTAEVWGAVRSGKGKNDYKWERQSMLFPATPSVSGNVNYLPPKD